jgi:hypothetical protein
MQAIAFMVVTDEYMVQVRDALKPHRGELHWKNNNNFSLREYITLKILLLN